MGRAAVDKKVMKVIGKSPGRGRGKGRGRGGSRKATKAPEPEDVDVSVDEPTPDAPVENPENGDGKDDDTKDEKITATMKQRWDLVEPCLNLVPIIIYIYIYIFLITYESALLCGSFGSFWYIKFLYVYIINQVSNWGLVHHWGSFI
jgi:hypothetical protein